MNLSDNEKRILSAFMQLIPKLSADIIERITLALNNEQRVKVSREAFVERLTQSGMSREDAEKEIVRYQRLIEGSSVNKDSIYNDDGSKKTAKKKWVEDQPVDIVEPVKPKKGKEKIDPIDNMIEELGIPEN